MSVWLFLNFRKTKNRIFHLFLRTPASKLNRIAKFNFLTLESWFSKILKFQNSKKWFSKILKFQNSKILKILFQNFEKWFSKILKEWFYVANYPFKKLHPTVRLFKSYFGLNDNNLMEQEGTFSEWDGRGGGVVVWRERWRQHGGRWWVRKTKKINFFLLQGFKECHSLLPIIPLKSWSLFRCKNCYLAKSAKSCSTFSEPDSPLSSASHTAFWPRQWIA